MKQNLGRETFRKIRKIETPHRGICSVAILVAMVCLAKSACCHGYGDPGDCHTSGDFTVKFLTFFNLAMYGSILRLASGGTRDQRPLIEQAQGFIRGVFKFFLFKAEDVPKNCGGVTFEGSDILFVGHPKTAKCSSNVDQLGVLHSVSAVLEIFEATKRLKSFSVEDFHYAVSYQNPTPIFDYTKTYMLNSDNVQFTRCSEWMLGWLLKRLVINNQQIKNLAITHCEGVTNLGFFDEIYATNIDCLVLSDLPKLNKFDLMFVVNQYTPTINSLLVSDVRTNLSVPKKVLVGWASQIKLLAQMPLELLDQFLSNRSTPFVAQTVMAHDIFEQDFDDIFKVNLMPDKKALATNIIIEYNRPTKRNHSPDERPLTVRTLCNLALWMESRFASPVSLTINADKIDWRLSRLAEKSYLNLFKLPSLKTFQVGHLSFKLGQRDNSDDPFFSAATKKPRHGLLRIKRALLANHADHAEIGGRVKDFEDELKEHAMSPPETSFMEAFSSLTVTGPADPLICTQCKQCLSAKSTDRYINILSCGHAFCSCCLNSWTSENPDPENPENPSYSPCPACSAVFNYQTEYCLERDCYGKFVIKEVVQAPRPNT
ncbi:hypothetical protein NEDG_00623 [Nematocida displodere]|uniref:RING-type domain-containing protein n=1 Tax=Nematocida displodere TaxID=1805483 RepID=A0A177EDM0_9MICR|nr:hypothetical protein NEDG_00623 [Nematocida displodere]